MESAQELASERVTTLMTAKEKSALELKARKAGVSVGELVRRSVDSYDPDEAASLDQLTALAAELQRSSRDASAALDRALASMTLTIEQLERRTPV
jgi:hypothetical protein